MVPSTSSQRTGARRAWLLVIPGVLVYAGYIPLLYATLGGWLPQPLRMPAVYTYMGLLALAILCGTWAMSLRCRLRHRITIIAVNWTWPLVAATLSVVLT